MASKISRRDFRNGGRVGLGAALLSSLTPAAIAATKAATTVTAAVTADAMLEGPRGDLRAIGLLGG